jgi:hypothetical protein
MSYMRPDGEAEVASVNAALRFVREIGGDQDTARAVFQSYYLGYSAVLFTAAVSGLREVTLEDASDMFRQATLGMDDMDPLRVHVMAGVNAAVNGTGDTNPANITDSFDWPQGVVPGPGATETYFNFD